MRHRARTGLLAATLVALLGAAPPLSTTAPAYTPDGRMLPPLDYRDWIFLSAGMDMSYVDGPEVAEHAFDNVFVTREAVAAFRETGRWPDKTVFVLEFRAGEQNGSINKRGRFQSELLGVEVHVKDEARFEGGWAFFAFDGPTPGRLLPRTANCYACHEQHGAVDTTFVQFYPTLLPIARAKGTLVEGR